MYKVIRVVDGEVVFVSAAQSVATFKAYRLNSLVPNGYVVQATKS